MFAAVLAAAAAAQLPQGPVVAPPKQAQKICRENEQRTGSHMRASRTCKTQEEWEIDDAARGRIPITLRVTREQDPARPK